MRKLISADAFRIFRSRWFWLCLGGMLALAASFVTMQYTAMDYRVPLSRVIFLPMSFYGMAVAALVTLFVGEDFSDGFIRNKIIAGCSKPAIFASNLVVSCLACMIIYLVTTLLTAAIGCLLFEIDVSMFRFLQHLTLGIGMCFAYSCIYCTITMVSGNKTTSIVLCMALAFFLLVACLHTNQIMVQPAYKDGMPNPAYVEGFAKVVYGVLHDLNPSGQTAQLSSMKFFQPIRCVLCDLLWILIAWGGCAVFSRKNLQ